MKHPKNQQAKAPTGKESPSLPTIHPGHWRTVELDGPPEWWDGKRVDDGYTTTAVDTLYADDAGHYLAREVSPFRWTLFDEGGRILRQDTVAYVTGQAMMWPVEFIALALAKETVDGILADTGADLDGTEDDDDLDDDETDDPEEADDEDESDPNQVEAPLVGASKQIELSEPMTEEQVAQSARDMAERQHDKNRLAEVLRKRQKKHKKEWKERQAQIDGLDAELTELADEVASKQRVVHVDCEWQADLHSNEWFLVKQGTTEEVPGHRRTMTAQEIERLTPLPQEPAPEPGDGMREVMEGTHGI